MDFTTLFSKYQEEWVQKEALRSLRVPQGIDFCSNDYLGFADSLELKERILQGWAQEELGSKSSRLLRGHSLKTAEFEKRLAQFSGAESALFFSTGYQANLALFSSLLKKDAVVFSDERIHASIIDGIRLSGCEKYIWPHNDLNHLELLLKQKASAHRANFVAVESIYSMSGNFAPLVELVRLCEKYGAYLIVDEAHATGLFGENGAGCVEALGLNSRIFAKIHTAGKALGVSGAWVAGSGQLMQLLVNTARPFIYTTAPAHYQQLACDIALEYLIEKQSSLQPDWRGRVEGFQKFLIDATENTNFRVSGWQSPVTALVCGSNQRALKVAGDLTSQGYDVRAVRPPSVPQGESLLRITLPLSRTTEEVEGLKKVLGECIGSVR